MIREFVRGDNELRNILVTEKNQVFDLGNIQVSRYDYSQNSGQENLNSFVIGALV